MAKLARLPLGNGAPEEAGAEVHHIHRPQPRYFAFLSYSHRDKDIADWLYGQLEQFRVPRALQSRLTANGVVPKRLTPIFRDEHELAAADDLGEEIRGALQSSQFLVVLCSPNAAKSRWTNAEIEAFKRIRPEGCVLAAIASGEPFASEIPGREGEECLPAALRHKYNRLGRSTGKRAEPLAADLRGGDDQRRIGFLKLVAGMIGVGLDDLVQRETTRRQRRLAWLTAASIAGMAVTSTLAVTAIQARDEAREQRRDAEGLVGFMLGDLKDKLEPIGKLDALDGVGSKVLAYYHKQGTGELTDAALSQRSKALSLMAQVATARGDAPNAVRLYREAMAGTGEAALRNPNDAQALFDHAQNVFYVGEIAHGRGDFRQAESLMREYQRLAVRMIALAPDNMKWRMEKQYADTNLGVILFDQRRFAEAARQFSDAQKTMDAIATADPGNRDYIASVAESLAWLADAERATGNYGAAIAARRRDISVLEQLSSQTQDVSYQQKLISARGALGKLYDEQGQQGLALQQYQAAVREGELLLPREPNNSVWTDYLAKARIDLGRVLLLTGNVAEATAQAGMLCEASNRLVNRDSKNSAWQGLVAACWSLRAKIALQTGAKSDAAQYSQRALSVVKTIHSGDRIADSFRLSRSYRLFGDIQQAMGNQAGAESSWAQALALLPPMESDEPDQAGDRALILRKLGRSAESQQIARRLQAIGYRHII